LVAAARIIVAISHCLHSGTFEFRAVNSGRSHQRAARHTGAVEALAAEVEELRLKESQNFHIVLRFQLAL
jgi:hypothetical protein